MTKRTKIVCTIGPASESRVVLEKMINAGMNVARLNFSHGNYKNHELLIRNIREVGWKLGQPVGLLQDLQGPRVRVGKLPQVGLSIARGDKVILIPESKINYQLLAASSDKILPIQYEALVKEVKPGSKILISDGLIELKVRKVKKLSSLISCVVVRGGTIFSFRGMNVPGVKIQADVITSKDKEDLRFGLKQNVDWVALSFVKEAKDVVALRKLIKTYQPHSQVKVMAKIERREAVDNFDQILAVVDGVMVARGDLGIELPAQQIPLIQKKIIEKCLAVAKPVIVATQMLESMMVNPRPTRAEVSDVANAVIDHTDAVMLSGETATGNFPVEAVTIMAKTISRTESSPYDDLLETSLPAYESVAVAAADSIHHLVKKLHIKAIVAATNSGHTARIIARFRPETKILVMTEDQATQQQLTLVWGVEARLIKVQNNLNKLIQQAVSLVHQEKIGKKGDKIIIASAYPVGSKENLNLVKIADI
ncbi:MAG: pyruvate kinase [Patescibacteria group bacterium]